jgi:hypothetical protein
VNRAGLFCGLLAPLLWAAVILLAGEARPGFDHAAQYISELAERGSNTQPLMRYGGFVATGLLHLGFALGFFSQTRRLGRPHWPVLLVALLIGLNGLGRIGAGFFACEPGCRAPEVLEQRLHSLAASVAFFAIAGATLFATFLFRRSARWLAAYSLASGLAGLLCLGLMSASEATHVNTGLYERLASGIFSLWIFITAARLWWLDCGKPAKPSRHD